MLKPGVKIDHETPVVVPRILVVHALFNIDIDTANRINDIDERMSVDDDVMVNVDAEKLFDGVLRHAHAAVSICRIDLVEAAVAYLDASVSWDRQQSSLIGDRVDGCDDQGIGSADIVKALVNAHDQHGRLIGNLQQLILIESLNQIFFGGGQIFDGVGGEQSTGSGRCKETCDQ